MKWNEVVVVLRAGNLLHLVPTYQISAIAHVHLASEKGATDGMKSGLPQIQTIKQINATRDPPGRVAALANVVRVTDDATWALTDELGKLHSCYRGAVRLYWPARTGADGEPYFNSTVWTASALLSNDSDGKGLNRFRATLRRFLAAGLILLLAATIDRFESLKGWGIEARTKKLDEKISQADQALDQLRQVAELATAAIIRLDTGNGRAGIVPVASESYTLAQKSIETLRALHSKPEQIQQIVRPWVSMMCADLASALIHPLHNIIQRKANEIGTEVNILRATAASENPIEALSKLTNEQNALRAFQDHIFTGAYECIKADFPESLCRMLESAPVSVRTETQEVIDRARSLGPHVVQLRNQLKLDEPEIWLSLIADMRRGRYEA